MRLVISEKCREISPAFVAANFDHAGAEHDPESKPAKKPEDDERRPAARKRPAIEKRAKENGEKAGLKQLRFPTVAIPILAKVDKRHVKNPKKREKNRVCVATGNDAGEGKTDPGRAHKHGVGMAKPEN